MMRKYNSQKTSDSGGPIAVVKVDKSGGCVDRDDGYLRQFRQAQIREYFFGNGKNTLSPHTQQVNFDQLHIFKVPEREKNRFCSPLPFVDH